MIFDTDALKELLTRSRSMREIGIGLFVGSVILGVAIGLPLSLKTPALEKQTAAVDTAVAAPNPYEGVALRARAAIVYDLATEQSLYERNADAQLPLASLTKLLAVYAALTTLPKDAIIPITGAVQNVDAPRAFSVGQSLPLADISRVTLTASLNDGAAAIVRAAAEKAHVSDAEVLATAVTALNLSQTYALNGNGLDLSDTVSGAYGSARDMARLSGALLRLAPDIVLATTRETATARSLDGQHFEVTNTDPAIHSIPHLLLSKTGFTDLAGGNLALVIDVGINHPVAIVVLGSSKEARFTDSTALIAATLAHFAGVASL